MSLKERLEELNLKLTTITNEHMNLLKQNKSLTLEDVERILGIVIRLGALAGVTHVLKEFKIIMKDPEQYIVENGDVPPDDTIKKFLGEE